MAANLDKAESALTTVSDLSFIRGIDSSGNSVKISKADLASVLGVITGTPSLTTTPATYNVLAGSWVFLSYEYQNEYVMGFCGRTGFLRISGDLQEHLDITISFDYSSSVLTITAPGGMYGCNLAILK